MSVEEAIALGLLLWQLKWRARHDIFLVFFISSVQKFSPKSLLPFLLIGINQVLLSKWVSLEILAEEVNIFVLFCEQCVSLCSYIEGNMLCADIQQMVRQAREGSDIACHCVQVFQLVGMMWPRRHEDGTSSQRLTGFVYHTWPHVTRIKAGLENRHWKCQVQKRCVEDVIRCFRSSWMFIE